MLGTKVRWELRLVGNRISLGTSKRLSFPCLWLGTTDRKEPLQGAADVAQWKGLKTNTRSLRQSILRQSRNETLKSYVSDTETCT